MSWVAKRAELAELAELLSRPVVRGFFAMDTPTSRKEALPFPLASIIRWELRICDKSIPLEEKLLIGTLLMMVWGGLRFGDIQRTIPLKLSARNGVIRGSC